MQRRGHRGNTVQGKAGQPLGPCSVLCEPFAHRLHILTAPSRRAEGGFIVLVCPCRPRRPPLGSRPAPSLSGLQELPQLHVRLVQGLRAACGIKCKPLSITLGAFPRPTSLHGRPHPMTSLLDHPSGLGLSSPSAGAWLSSEAAAHAASVSRCTLSTPLGVPVATVSALAVVCSCSSSPHTRTPAAPTPRCRECGGAPACHGARHVSGTLVRLCALPLGPEQSSSLPLPRDPRTPRVFLRFV